MSVALRLPVDHDAERSAVADAAEAVVSACLIDGDAIDRASAIVAPSDFQDPALAVLFAVMVEMRREREVADPITVGARLETREDRPADYKDLLGFLCDAVPTSANVEYHARLVEEAAKRRAMAERLESSAAELRTGAVSADVATRLRPALDMLAIGRANRGFPNYDDDELDALPVRPDVVDRMLPRGGSACMYGAPGLGKSFIALLLAFCIRVGLDFFGRAVECGGVWYIAAEGMAGIPKRLAALKRHHGYEGRVGLRFIFESVNLLDPATVSRFLATIAASDTPKPALVVFDTLARCMPGGDENSAMDMGKVIASVERIQRETGACVLLVHHPGKQGDVERGSSALRGAMDVMIPVTGADGEITLALDTPAAKTKDGGKGEPIRLRLVPTDNSCVLFPARTSMQLTTEEPTATERTLLVSLHSAFVASEGATATEWQKASGIAERTFYVARTRLVARNYVAGGGAKRGARYSVTPAGLAWITAHCTEGAR